MTTTNTKIVKRKVSFELADELLLRAVIDSEFRDELLDNPKLFIDCNVSSTSARAEEDRLFENSRATALYELPIPVLPQDMSFVELVKDAADINACISTCISGFTIICDGNTMDPNCRNTCISGYTIRCDGNTL